MSIAIPKGLQSGDEIRTFHKRTYVLDTTVEYAAERENCYTATVHEKGGEDRFSLFFNADNSDMLRPNEPGSNEGERDLIQTVERDGATVFQRD